MVGCLCRQHHGIISCDKGHQVRVPKQRSPGTFALGASTPHCHQDNVVCSGGHPEWPPKCYCRCNEQERPSPLHRVDTPSGGLQGALATVGPTVSRPLCYRLQAFVSPFPNPMALKSDAFLFNLDHLELYTFPPTAILCKVINKLLLAQVSSLILIARSGPSRSGSRIS